MSIMHHTYSNTVNIVVEVAEEFLCNSIAVHCKGQSKLPTKRSLTNALSEVLDTTDPSVGQPRITGYLGE